MSPALIQTANSGPDLTRYLLVCGFLILLIVGLGFGFRRLVGGTIRARAAKRSLETLDVLPLGSKQKLAVVRCYDRNFLIGIGEKNPCLIAELDPSVDPVPSVAPAPPAPRAAAPTTPHPASDPEIPTPATPRTTAEFLRELELEERRADQVVESRPTQRARLTADGRGILG